jgi:hypothetical protein
MEKNLIDKVIDLAIDGLTVDGGYHKQFYLEEIIRSLVTQERFDELKDEWDWAEGIPD